MIRALMSLIRLPFRLGFGLIRLGFELFFGLFQGVFGLVFGLLGLVLGLFKGLFGLILIGAVIAFISGMFNRGFKSGTRQKFSASDAFEQFQSYYHSAR